jgi:hypothetical protein
MRNILSMFGDQEGLIRSTRFLYVRDEGLTPGNVEICNVKTSYQSD